MNTLTLFHGSPEREGRPAFGSKENLLPVIKDGKPFWVTKSLPYATYFARGGIVTQIRVKSRKTLDLNDFQKQAELLNIFNHEKLLTGCEPWDEDVDGEISDSAYFLLESPAVMRHLRNLGYDCVYVPEDKEMRVTSYALLDVSVIEHVSVLQTEVEPGGPGF